MRGTPEAPSPEVGFITRAGNYLGETLQSKKSETLQRFDVFVEEDHVFPIEGTLETHSTGSYIRGNWIMHDEDTLRAKAGLPPLLERSERARQKWLHKTHDLGELKRLRHDILHGNKTDQDRQDEADGFKFYASQAPTELQPVLEWVHDTTENHQESTAGRLWKNYVEHVAFIETARRLYRHHVLGEPLDMEKWNAESRIYLRHAVAYDEQGRPIEPKLIGVEALIADILVCSGDFLKKASGEFLGAQRYLERYGAELEEMCQRYILNDETNIALTAEITRLKEYHPDKPAANPAFRQQEAGLLIDFVNRSRRQVGFNELTDGVEERIAA
ncbi:hypothetical protein HY374_02840 [Candidatus Berkelbacteria bacterium]|nr:hypothetical protein [Candidatus Berkelbacteria bacterium]